MRDARFKKLFNTKEYYIKKDRERTALFNHSSLFDMNAKLYVCKTYGPRGLIMELYCLPGPNRREGISESI